MEAVSRIFFQPPGGMYREFHALKTYLTPADLDLYRRLLPEPLEVPEIPLVMIFVADYTRVASALMPHYREMGVLLRSVFRGEPGWFTLTMPVSSRFAMWLGRSVGFPKYIPDQLTVEGDEQGCDAQLQHRGAQWLCFVFRPGPHAPLPAWTERYLKTETFFHDEVHFPLSGEWVRTVQFAHLVPPRSSLQLGCACVTTDPGQPWAGLIPQGATAPAAYCKFTGGMNLVVTPVR